GFVRIVVHLDQQCVGAGGDRSTRHRGDFVPQTSSVRRIGSYRQMRKFVDDRNRADVEGVSSVSFKSANAALASDDVVIAAGHDVFGGEQKFLDGGGNAAFQKNRSLQ